MAVDIIIITLYLMLEKGVYKWCAEKNICFGQIKQNKG